MNLVQQAAQENVLVLLGFSGEDPNFLSWTGWVRDYLGDNAPTVYLCGLLDLSASDRKLLEDRKVAPVDLSTEFPVESWPDRDERHRKAIEWFLLNLMSSRPPDPADWLGRRESGSHWEPSPGLPPLPSVSSFTLQEDMTPSPGDGQQNRLAEIVEVWSQQREEYPGWAVAPREKRERLAQETEHWIDPLLDAVRAMAPQDGIHSLYEVNWRLERALVPLFSNWSTIIASVLEGINPYPAKLGLPEASVTPETAEHTHLEWGILATQWVELAFAVARMSREDQNESGFRRWMDRLGDVVDRHAEWHARWFYEECQYLLFCGELKMLRARLAEWPEDLGGPGWSLKRAALLAELGEVREANRLAETCLERIRTQLPPGSRDLALLSQEEWAMTLLQITRPNLPASKRRKEDFRERLRQLAPFGINPFRELHEAELILAGPTPEEKAGARSEVTRGFDPGRQTTTTKFESGFPVSPFFPAFGLARMLEEGALPPRCGNVTVQKEAVLNAARWIEPYAPLWSLSLLLRAAKTGADKELEDRFGRVRVATLETEDVERLYDTFSVAWVQAMRYLTDNTHELTGSVTGLAERQVRVLSDVLSRLSIRLDDRRRGHMFELATQMYESALFRQSLKLHGCVGLVFGRLLSQAMDRSEVLNQMHRLLSLPIPGDGGFTVSQPSEWPEPLDYLAGWPPGNVLPAGFDRSSWTPHIQRLILLARSSDLGQVRERAIRRLDRLFVLGTMSESESLSFGEALWSSSDPTSRLPSQTGLFAFSFLSLPHPPDIDAEGRVRAHLLARDFPPVVNNGMITLRGQDEVAQELRVGTTPLIAVTEQEWRDFVPDWSQEEAVGMLRKMSDLWNREKDAVRGHLDSSFGLPGGDLAGRFIDWVRLLAEVILPRLSNSDDATKEIARTLVSELNDAGVPTFYATPTLLYLDAGTVQHTSNQLEEGLGSPDSNTVGEAIRGLVLWLTLQARDSRVPSPPGRLLDELVIRILSYRMPGMELALIHLTNLLRIHPEQLGPGHLDVACRALRYLLEDTRLPNAQEQRDLGEIHGPISIGERPRYRALSASLASHLAARYAELGEPLPEILSLWREAISTDTLPEVRRAWQGPNG